MFNKISIVLIVACIALGYFTCKLYSRCSILQQQVAAYEETNKQLLAWQEEQQKIIERKETIDEAIAEVADPEWNSDVLPDAYLRVLGEAGIYTGTTTGSVAAGNGTPQNAGEHK